MAPLVALLLAQLLVAPQARFLARKDAGSGDGDLADKEVEKIQLAEDIDDTDEKQAVSIDSDSADGDEEGFDAEARRMETYGDDESASAAALIQHRGGLHAQHEGDDDGDLADEEVDKIQMSEQLDDDHAQQAAEADSENDEEEFEADTEARRSEMYDGYDTESSAALIQKKVGEQSQEPGNDDDGDLADQEVEKIQLEDELDDGDNRKMSVADPDSADEDFDADAEARRSEMYEGYDSERSAALVQSTLNKSKK